MFYPIEREMESHLDSPANFNSNWNKELKKKNQLTMETDVNYNPDEKTPINFSYALRW